MPEVVKQYCDICGEEIFEDKYLIYDINVWSKKLNTSKKYDFLLDNGIAKMFCGEECIGNFIMNLIDKGEE